MLLGTKHKYHVFKVDAMTAKGSPDVPCCPAVEKGDRPASRPEGEEKHPKNHAIHGRVDDFLL